MQFGRRRQRDRGVFLASGAANGPGNASFSTDFAAAFPSTSTVAVGLEVAYDLARGRARPVAGVRFAR
eukprot:6294813-Lingulodinium_polyedra.AAC.1